MPTVAVGTAGKRAQELEMERESSGKSAGVKKHAVKVETHKARKIKP